MLEHVLLGQHRSVYTSVLIVFLSTSSVYHSCDVVCLVCARLLGLLVSLEDLCKAGAQCVLGFLFYNNSVLLAYQTFFSPQLSLFVNTVMTTATDSVLYMHGSR
jgi:hypothetical protein